MILFHFSKLNTKTKIKSLMWRYETMSFVKSN